MSMRNTRARAWIVRVLLCAQVFSRAFRVRVFPIVRPVESAADAVESAVLVAVHCVVHCVAHAITVHVVCDLASHVVERLPHQHMNTI